jgi:hypothetical protein
MQRLRPATRLPSALAFFGALAFLLPKSAPGITLEDAGELSAAAACLGVAHPPGYPLFVLLGGLWLRLLAPLGIAPGAALSAFSAVCAAATLALLVGGLSARGARWSALAAGLALLQAGPFLSQAIVIEVYALAGLCLALALRLACAATPRPLTLGLALGLAIVAHPAGAGGLPLALAALLPAGARLQRSARLAAGLALGLAPFLALPVLAQGDPPLCWGQPDSLARWSAHLLRSQYGSGTGLAFAERLHLASELLWRPFGLWLPTTISLGALCAGLGRFLRRAPARSLAAPAASAPSAGPKAEAASDRPPPPSDAAPLLPLTLAAAAATLLCLLAWSHPTPDDDARARLIGSALPAVVLIAALAGACLGALERRLAPRLGALLLIPLALLPIAGRGQALKGAGARLFGLALDQSSARLAEEYAALAFAEAPADSVLIANRLGSTDLFGFPLLHRQIALRERPDLLLIDRSLLEAPWYREQLARRAPALAPALAALERELASAGADPAAQRRASRVLFAALLAGPRPVGFTDPPGPAALGGAELEPGGVLWWPAGQGPRHEGEDPLAAAIAAEPASPWLERFREELTARQRARLR